MGEVGSTAAAAAEVAASKMVVLAEVEAVVVGTVQGWLAVVDRLLEVDSRAGMVLKVRERQGSRSQLEAETSRTREVLHSLFVP